MKKNNKGFTLVELIVVLVILAILAAILVPALLGYIDKAREKKITTNAEAALVAAQAIVTEQYGLGNSSSDAETAAEKWSNINRLAEIKSTGTATPTLDITLGNGSDSKHNGFIITAATYTENGKSYSWTSTTGEWTEVTTTP